MRYNNTTKKWDYDYKDLCYGIVYIDNNYVEFGYFENSPVNIPILYQSRSFYLDKKEHSLLPLYWRNSSGCYTVDPKLQDNIITRSKDNFFYPIPRCYNFCKLSLKPKSVKVFREVEFQYLNPLTFGLEYETSAGNIPWLDCLDLNLVPLYDGSINGHEYVTFPLTYKNLPIVNQHLQLLKRYTKYDKNCSLHIHFGGFPIVYDKIDALCKYWHTFQYIIEKYIPYYSYSVELYKDNGKAYNKVWHLEDDLKTFYEDYTGNQYTDDNSFYKPNAYDKLEERKWEVSGRYYNMNIMHLIAGKKTKTVEFRFLRPTTNYSEIKWYILVLGAFLMYVIRTDEKCYDKITINKVLECIYPENIVANIQEEGMKLYHLRKIQITNGDLPGINNKLKDVYLSLQKFSI